MSIAVGIVEAVLLGNIGAVIGKAAADDALLAIGKIEIDTPFTEVMYIKVAHIGVIRTEIRLDEFVGPEELIRDEHRKAKFVFSAEFEPADILARLFRAHDVRAIEMMIRMEKRFLVL